MSNPRPPFTIVPIKKVDVFRSLLAQLEGYIAETGMKRGDRLGSERELAEQFQVSRVSVREALRSLEALGKVEIRRNAGSFIADPNGTSSAKQLKGNVTVDESFLRHLVDVRSAIEVKVVQLVAANPDANLAQVAALLARAEGELLEEEREEGSLDLRFEAALGRECGNPLLAHFQQIVHELWIDAWSELGIAPGDWEALHEQHKEILAALEKGDGDLAVQLMIDHADRSLD
jgi:GntR family transcriptional regulator, transcriptional repressor for pyruvate dehydrogenase complex